MVNGKDELATDQLDAVSGGTKVRSTEVETTVPVTKVPTPSGPVPIPYPNTAVKQTHVTVERHRLLSPVELIEPTKTMGCSTHSPRYF